MRTRLLPSSNDSVVSEHSGHTTVLLHEAIEILEIKPSDIVVDATLGGAGHFGLIADTLDETGTLIGFDLDESAIARAHTRVHETRAQTLFVHDNFRHIEKDLREKNISHVDKVVFDLGWSGYQLSAGRGFSFLADEPLRMTYSDGDTGLTAREIVNEWAEESIADILYGWGEETAARRIAHAIVEARARAPIETSKQLGEIIREAVPAFMRHRRIHPATKSFQALRIAVNDELGALKDGLLSAWHMLATGGRISVITFHSIEDRIVKNIFAEWEHDGSGVRINRHVITPSSEELHNNPRARSAKLRCIERI